MSLFSTLRDLFSLPAPPAPTAKQTGRKADAIRLLMHQGFITNREIANMGDNSPTKTIWRMRLDGVLNADASNPRGYRDVPNAEGNGKHRQYLWTGKLPAGWKPFAVPVRYKPLHARFGNVERRARARGGRA